jgi:hypothetical protein
MSFVNEHKGQDPRPLIASAIGVRELRVGFGLTYIDGRRKGEDWLSHMWDLTFQPTFNSDGMLAVIAASKLDDEDNPQRSWLQVALVFEGHAFSQLLEVDPVLPLLGTLPLFHPPDFRQWRDGHGYRLNLTTTDLDWVLEFDNPTLPDLKRIEAASLKLADDVANASRNPHLKKLAAIWSGYVERAR